MTKQVVGLFQTGRYAQAPGISLLGTLLICPGLLTCWFPLFGGLIPGALQPPWPEGNLRTSLPFDCPGQFFLTLQLVLG